MITLEKKYFANRKSFRNWLEKNHNRSSGIWMLFYKKHTNRESINYSEALEEALCFGWIDSIIKRVDEEQYVRKFTPRTNISNWSEINKKIVLAMIEKGKMTEAGLNKIDIYLQTGKVEWKATKPKNKIKKTGIEIPDFILQAFTENEPALTKFNNLAPSHKREYVLWITTAKKEETILKRLKECIELLKGNKKLGLK